MSRNPTTTIDTSRLDAEMTPEQQAEVERIVADLHDDEVRSLIVLRTVPFWRAPYPQNTVMFRDGTMRRWYVRPDGSIDWTG